MPAERVKFARNYDHIWPNRAQTAFKAGWEGPVKTEVAERARELGVLDEGDALPTTRDALEKLAAHEGVDVSAIEGTGSRGYVTNDDVTAAILANRAAKSAPEQDVQPEQPVPGEGDDEGGETE